MPNPAVPAPQGTNPPDPTRPDDPHLVVVLTCTDCRTSYEPTVEDFARGRTACPAAGCRGWAFTAALVEPADPAATGGAR